MRSFLAASALLSLASSASAALIINNWCSTDVFFWVGNNGNCDQGPNGICSPQPGSEPYHIPAGNGGSSMITHQWIANSLGTSVKIGKNRELREILQFEYTMGPGGLYWDLSDLDGAGNGLVGTPFRPDNVKASPTGNGVGTGTCVQIRCRANEVCLDSYQHPDDVNTRFCPADTGDMYLDLCQPEAQFNSKRSIGKRSLKFTA